MRSSFNPDNLTPENTPSKQAFCKARKKVNATAFTAINKLAVDSYYETLNTGFDRFFRLRLLAVDGSSIRLEEEAYADMINSHQDLDLDLQQCRKSYQAPLARTSLIYDVLNEIAIDAQLKPTVFSELEILASQLSKTGPNDVLVMDRGYHCYWFVALLEKLNIKFVIRAQTSQKPIRDFIKNGEEDGLVTLNKPAKMTTSPRHKALIDEADLETIKSLNLRLVRYVSIDQNEEAVTYVMLTNLIDSTNYPKEGFRKLYKARWKVEEAFKTYKVSVEIERWSGLSWKSALQDFHSTILLTNMTRIFSFEVEDKIRTKSHERVQKGELKYKEKLNITEAVRSFRILVRNIIKVAKFEGQKHLQGFCKSIKIFKTLIRDDRNFPHDRKNNHARFNMNCKSSF